MRAPLAQKAMAGLRDRIGLVVDDLIDEFVENGVVELMNAFSLRLPGFVILDMLGAPRSDLSELTHYTNELQLFLGQAQGVSERYKRAETAAARMEEYFGRLVASKRTRPGADLTTMLVDGVRKGDLNDDELIAYCMLIFFGGQETTANLIGNGLIALMRHRGELEKLRERPELARSAVAECLRYDGPIGAVVRIVGRDHELGGKTLRIGERIFAMVNAANRDPAQFADPDRFDVERSGNRHLTFGQGLHFCLGAPLAGLETEIALVKLVARLENVEHARESLDWRDGLNMRGVVSLPLQFTPQTRLGR
jgi:cytochrome P450